MEAERSGRPLHMCLISLAAWSRHLGEASSGVGPDCPVLDGNLLQRLLLKKGSSIHPSLGDGWWSGGDKKLYEMGGDQVMHVLFFCF